MNRSFRISGRIRKNFMVLVISIVFTALGCTQNNKVSESLKSAEGNRAELEKVLHYFEIQKNHQKLKAAQFLVAELSTQFHLEGKSVDRYLNLFQTLKEVPKSRMEDLEMIWDSLKKGLKTPIGNEASSISDAKTLRAEILIDHINNAFIAWKNPWSKNLSFDDFCEYILPYKLVNEKPEEWMGKIQRRYKFLYDNDDSLSINSYTMCLKVNKVLKKDFKIRSFPAMLDLNFNQLDILKSGKCFHATQYGTYVMRSFGIPVTMDFTPLWGNMNGGHQWNALIYKGQTIPFVSSESDPGLTKIDLARMRKRAKIFRRTFSYQKSSLAARGLNYVDIPPLFKTYHIKDVTSEYIPTSSIILKDIEDLSSNGIIYLCVFNNQQWLPTAWASLDSGGAIFTQMGRDIVYLPMFYVDGELIPAGESLMLDNQGNTVVLSQKTGKTKLIIKQKGPEGPGVKKGQNYSLLRWEKKWKEVSNVTAICDSIVFKNVPKNGLYRLNSQDKTLKERIFIIENDKPFWR